MAPVVVVTSSTEALRCYLCLLSAHCGPVLLPWLLWWSAIPALVQFALQGLTLDKVVSRRLAKRQTDVQVARALDSLDPRRPCLVYGEHAVMIAYRAGCAAHTVLRWRRESEMPASVRAAQAAGKRVVAVVRGRATPAPFLLAWARTPLTVATRIRSRCACLPHPAGATIRLARSRAGAALMRRCQFRIPTGY